MTAVIFISVLLTASYSVFSLSLTTAEKSRQYNLAELLAHDLLELTVSKRNENWNALTPGEYHFTKDEVLGLLFVPGNETVDEFTRSVVISAVARDSSGNIVTSGGTTDPRTFKVTSTVTWQYGTENHKVELVRYLTDWRRF